MLPQVYMIGVFLSFLIHVYSYMTRSVAIPQPTHGGCPIRHFSKLFTASINSFSPFGPSSSRITITGQRTSKEQPREQPREQPTTTTTTATAATSVIRNSEVFTTSVQEAKQGLPWTESITSTAELTYMPMLQKQLDVIKAMGMEQVDIQERFIYKTSSARPARIGNMCFRNKEFRCVRLSYFDGGDSVQVFNSLWYPSYEYDIPMFGVDLISLGKNRILNVIDFQPLHPTEEYSNKYIQPLSSIRSKYPDLQGVLSGKIYDDTSFFSKNMLFGRFSDTSKVLPIVKPAYDEYFDAYIHLMRNATPDQSPESMEIVYERQKAYDIYSALKDPAVGLFDAYFGKEWSHDFVHDFLFQLSKENKQNVAVSIPETNHIDKTKSSQSQSQSQSAVHTFAINSNGEIQSTTRSSAHHHRQQQQQQ